MYAYKMLLVALVAATLAAGCQSVAAGGHQPVVTAPELQGGVSQEQLGACYPREARQLGEEPRVVALVEVAADGTARLLGVPAGTDERIRQAVDCVVGTLHFLPATRNGVPISSTTRLPVNFKLAETGMPTMPEADMSTQLALKVLKPRTFESIVQMAASWSPYHELAARIMREDPAWKKVVIEQESAALRQEFTADDLERIDAFVSSPLGDHWTAATAMATDIQSSPVVGKAIVTSGCMAVLLAREVEAARPGASPNEASLTDEDRLDRLRTRGVNRESTTCSCVADRFVEDFESRSNKYQRPTYEVIMGMVDDGTCPAP